MEELFDERRRVVRVQVFFRKEAPALHCMAVSAWRPYRESDITEQSQSWRRAILKGNPTNGNTIFDALRSTPTASHEH